MKILVTGGTVFVSKFIAKYYAEKGEEVYVLNRNNHQQIDGVTLIEADRNNLGNVLKDYEFDVVLDVTAYTGEDVRNLLDALGAYKDYILISSSAVYPETLQQPFKEDAQVGVNKFWGKYGTNKIEAEIELLNRIPSAYVLRPPYLYGSMNNVYREAFVFDCAMKKRKFFLPKDGSMKLQFFHVHDLCRLIDAVLEQKPQQHILNVGNQEIVSIKEWVDLCYQIVGEKAVFVTVDADMNQREYFSFYDYEYILDVSSQEKFLSDVIPLKNGLREAYEWYLNNSKDVIRKKYIEFIDEFLQD